MTLRHSHGRIALWRTTLVLAAGLAAGALAPGAAAARTLVGGGNPHAVPPILPPLTPSGLHALRISEAAEARRAAYRLPVTARYSGAEMAVFALEGIASLEVPLWHRP